MDAGPKLGPLLPVESRFWEYVDCSLDFTTLAGVLALGSFSVAVPPSPPGSGAPEPRRTWCLASFTAKSCFSRIMRWKVARHPDSHTSASCPSSEPASACTQETNGGAAQEAHPAARRQRTPAGCQRHSEPARGDCLEVTS